VLVHFPFTDLTSNKKRPALILSPLEYVRRYGDVVVLAMTGQPQPEPDLQLKKWQEAGLLKPTWLKPVIATLKNQMIERRLGALDQADFAIAARAIKLAISSQFTA